MSEFLAIIVLSVVLSVYSLIVTLLYVREKRSSRLTRRLQRADNSAQMAELDSEERFRLKADEAMRLTQTFQKFVPRQFVEHFAKHGTVNLELGHADEDEVAILFCDIRGFTGLSERMRPQELMNFLNSYFLRMNDPIHQNGGFIDKFIGDAIMALFDHPGGTQTHKTRDALSAALDLRKAITIYNMHRSNSGYEPINIGIGIHYGPVIIGTVGSDDRMDTTVIGDSVNIASRLEGLSPVYHADIIISAQVLEALGPDYPIRTKLLDWVRVKGRKAPLQIYEVLSHLPDAEIERKLATETFIKAGIEYRITKNWEEAKAQFYQALTLQPDDPLIAHHISVCEKYEHLKLSADWDGALEL